VRGEGSHFRYRNYGLVFIREMPLPLFLFSYLMQMGSSLVFFRSMDWLLFFSTDKLSLLLCYSPPPPRLSREAWALVSPIPAPKTNGSERRWEIRDTDTYPSRRLRLDNNRLHPFENVPS